MSVAAMSWGFAQKVPPAEKLVLLALADHSDDRGKCWPGIDGVAEKTGLSRRTVQRQIRALERSGLIRSQVRQDETGRQTSSTYVLAIREGVKMSPRGDTDVTPEGDTGDTPEGVTVTPESSIRTTRGTVNESTPIGVDVRGDAAHHRAGQEKTKDHATTCPHQEIIDLYRAILPMCRQVREWNDTRKGYLRSRWREKPERQDLDWWRKFFGYVAMSPFLTGQVEGRDGKPPFIADLEWLIRPANFAKIIEGKYHHDHQRRAA